MSKAASTLAEANAKYKVSRSSRKDGNPVTDNLDLWSSVLLTRSTVGRGSNGKLEAYGIKKLRELILELAVRGKLVPQDPNDEPASVLLENITKEKIRLVQEGKIKKQRPLAEISEDEKPYNLPVGWVFVRLGNVAFSQAGFAFKSRFFNENAEGLPLIRIRDVGQPFTGTYYSGEYRDEFLVEEGDYLISMDGEFRVSPWFNGQALLNQRVSRLIFYYEDVGKRFIADCLQARLCELQGVKAYTTVDHLSGAQITESVLGLPPLAEQHRIVAKLDELMALCDQLEQQQAHSHEAHQTLVEALLGTLTDVESAQDLAEAWTRIADHFDTLFTTEHSIDQLKKTILQLSVMGKLVPQDTNDEAASLLLENIAKEKAKLVEEGKIRKQKPLPVISKNEKLFDVPDSWEWARLDDLSLHSEAGWSPSCETTPREDDKWGVLKVSAVTWGVFNPNENKALPDNLEPKPEYEVKPGDFLISRANTADLVARAVVVPDGAPSYLMMSDKIIRFVFSKKANHKYLELVNSSLFSRKYYARVAGGTSSSMKNVSREQIRNLVIALPPLAEQHRIVAKVDELMALCDSLKARIKDAQTTQIHLADAIVEQAVA